MPNAIETLKTDWYKVAHSENHRLATLQKVTGSNQVYYTVNGDTHYTYDSLKLANEYFLMITS